MCTCAYHLNTRDGLGMFLSPGYYLQISDINASTPLPWKMKTYIPVTPSKFVGENITLQVQVKDVQPNEEDSTNKSD